MNYIKKNNKFTDSSSISEYRVSHRDNNIFDLSRKKNQFSYFKGEKEKKPETFYVPTNEDFPELLSEKTIGNEKLSHENDVKGETQLFSDILEKKCDVVEENEPVKKLKPGWIVLNGDMKCQKQKQDDNLNQDEIKELMYNLVLLYNRQEEEFIKLYGEHTFNKTFKFPNYDYEYFDKLDELDELENFEHASDMSDEYYDYDDYFNEVD